MFLFFYNNGIIRSDLSFRLLVRRYGAQVTFTEMCVAEYYIDRTRKQVKQYEWF
jgi:tRNA-dihydrouridine synthase